MQHRHWHSYKKLKVCLTDTNNETGKVEHSKCTPPHTWLLLLTCLFYQFHCISTVLQTQFIVKYRSLTLTSVSPNPQCGDNFCHYDRRACTSTCTRYEAFLIIKTPSWIGKQIHTEMWELLVFVCTSNPFSTACPVLDSCIGIKYWYTVFPSKLSNYQCFILSYRKKQSGFSYQLFFSGKTIIDQSL